MFWVICTRLTQFLGNFTVLCREETSLYYLILSSWHTERFVSLSYPLNQSYHVSEYFYIASSRRGITVSYVRNELSPVCTYIYRASQQFFYLLRLKYCQRVDSIRENCKIIIEERFHIFICARGNPLGIRSACIIFIFMYAAHPSTHFSFTFLYQDLEADICIRKFLKRAMKILDGQRRK